MDFAQEESGLSYVTLMGGGGLSALLRVTDASDPAFMDALAHMQAVAAKATYLHVYYVFKAPALGAERQPNAVKSTSSSSDPAFMEMKGMLLNRQHTQPVFRARSEHSIFL